MKAACIVGLVAICLVACSAVPHADDGDVPHYEIGQPIPCPMILCPYDPCEKFDPSRCRTGYSCQACGCGTVCVQENPLG